MAGSWDGQVGRSPGLVVASPVSVGSLNSPMSERGTGFLFPI